MDLFPLNCK